MIQNRGSFHLRTTHHVTVTLVLISRLSTLTKGRPRPRSYTRTGGIKVMKFKSHVQNSCAVTSPNNCGAHVRMTRRP
ncbi:Protein of unknown function [Pyronema omphalodes CBS 100304]|uniref:Secreted protein n=1 Tax=Pyronema omphalodes (strain CBS 100304) TaxID=1076935 RepID=U4LV87_PYROM|nr:Protein of unknown function [Pyronema omphalodes CBS 100304]